MNNQSDIISSFPFDARLAPYDIIGSSAHVKMLEKCRIITKADARKILKGLDKIYADVIKGKIVPAAEDIHYAIEKELIKMIGPVGGKMHTARSRNDQVALDLRLYLREEIKHLIDDLCHVQQAIVAKAKEHPEAVMPGFTHLQPAQPVLFAHHILSYAWMFERDKERLIDCFSRVNILPLGSAALAGTSFPIDRGYVAELLGFEGISDNSIDAVSDRDFAVEFLAAGAIIALHLSRLCEELVLWSSSAFSFITIADEFTSGSSIMPQKKNPDVAEIIRGKTGRVYGNLTALLTILKGLPLAYNRDMQEDKPPVFDTVESLSPCLEAAAAMLATLKVHDRNMLLATQKGFLAATELADYLVRKGMPFRQAHGIIQSIVADCQKNGTVLEEMDLSDFKEFSGLFGEDAKKFISPRDVIHQKTSEGGTSPASVKKQIAKLEKLTAHKH